MMRERLRDEPGRGTVVLVRIALRIRVELDLTIVEVEDRGVIEANIRIRIFASARPYHRSSKAVLTGCKMRSYS